MERCKEKTEVTETLDKRDRGKRNKMDNLREKRDKIKVTEETKSLLIHLALLFIAINPGN